MFDSGLCETATRRRLRMARSVASTETQCAATTGTPLSGPVPVEETDLLLVRPGDSPPFRQGSSRSLVVSERWVRIGMPCWMAKSRAASRVSCEQV